MAFGYKADYGYYIDPNGTGHGTLASPYLDGKNINDCVITDRDTKYFIAEVDDLPYPTNIGTGSTDREAMRGRFRDERHTGTAPRLTQGITDWRYYSLFPGQTTNANFNDQDIFSYAYWSICQVSLEGNYSPFTIVDQPYKGNPFRWCPKLCKAMVPVLYGHVACTFVYLKTWHKLIDQFGNMYTVGSNGLITRYVAQTTEAKSIVWISSYTGGTVIGYSYMMIAYKNPQNNQYTSFSCHMTFRGGAVYQWAVFSDLNTINDAWTTFYGLNQGNYDFKSEPGEDPDPYAQTGEKSKPGGGGGTGVIPGRQSTTIPGVSDLPTDSILYRYKLDSGGIAAVTSALWSDDFLQAIKRTIYQPMDCIISMHYLPYDIETTGWSNSIHMGNYVIPNTASTEVAKQYQEINCGSVRVNEIWGSYLDYHCRINLYLPFIGSIMLQPEDVVGHDLSVRYLFDNLTGTCVAHVISDDVVVGEYGGNCCYEIPLTGASYGELIGNLISLAGTSIAVVGSAVATGGVSAPLIAGEAATALSTAFSKENHQRAGGLGGASSLMNVRTPYLTVYVPNLCIPEDQNEFTGYPSYITVTLGSQHGYTEVYKSHVHINGASDAEIMEIETLLNQGVIIA